VLGRALREGRAAVKDALAANQAALASRRSSPRVHKPAVQAAVAAIDARLGERQSPYVVRAEKQSAWLKLPLY
ncbi:hypothetical protein, partial [Escherichia coli]|uniref:hypothetical protein n=1 Tax=Escherichia coli TaxID=562 RepID=UPI00116A0536